MPTLIKVIANTDWKHRASHSIEKLGTGTIEELRAIQDADVKEWQQIDLDNDNDEITKDAEMEGDIAPMFRTEWTITDEEGENRWEMARTEGEEFRMFCGHIEGDSWSVSYQVLPD